MITKQSLVLIPILLFSACQKDTVTTIVPSSFETSITGSWQAVLDDGTPVAVEWGGLYVGTVTIRSDHSFVIDDISASTSNKTGTWQLKGHMITFFTDFLVFSTNLHYKENTIFNALINGNHRLVLSNNSNIFQHIKVGE
jgi:hypothetical protein